MGHQRDKRASAVFLQRPNLGRARRKNLRMPLSKSGDARKNLEETVNRYNQCVEKGVDEDFDKPKPQFKIATPPFYAAWATITVHDTYAGLRINMQCQVLDMNGEVIPGLYCGGESAAGCSQHGLGRCFTQGYIAGGEAVKA